MDLLTHTFENYITSIDKINLHKKTEKDFYNKLPANIKDIPHLILYGKEGIGKYSQALKIISKYSNYKKMTYEKMIVNFNKDEYIFSISDIHFEVDMSLLGCNSKLLFYEIINQINEVVEIRKNRIAFVLCKNFQNIHHELLDNFYIYLSSNIMSNIELKFIIITTCISFIPYNILNCSTIIPYETPNKSTIQKIKKNNVELKNNINIKSIIYNKDQSIMEEEISKKIVDLIFEENIDYSLIRETIYEILTCNLNIHNCLYEINKILFKRISKQKIKKILDNNFLFFKYYNNNYRPIYHLENYFYYLLTIVNEYE